VLCGRRPPAQPASERRSDTPSNVTRRLAATAADFEPDLTKALWIFALVRAAGDTDLANALDAAREAVAVCERLSEQWPDAFVPQYSGATKTLADILDRLGRADDAAVVRQRAGPSDGRH
jgi:hypothetical protein